LIGRPVLEPDAAIDTRLTNGRLVREHMVEPGGFIVRDGRIAIDSDPQAQAWRTVDASGFYVLPALIQPGLPIMDGARALALSGVGTAIVTLRSASLATLTQELDSLAREATLDYVVCWQVPDQAPPADLRSALALGVTAFEMCESLERVPPTATLRLPLESAESLISNDGHPTRVVQTTADPEHARAAARRTRPGQFIELSTASLSDDVRDWSAVAELDRSACVTGDTDLLLKLFEYGVRSCGMTVEKLARLASVSVAAAYGIDGSKRGLALGADADVVVFDADALGDGLPGRAVFSLLRGEILLYNDDVHTAPGSGKQQPV
jgi:hypothetical protein